MRSNVRAVSYLVLVFLLGALIGTVGTYWANSAGWVNVSANERRSKRPSSVEWLSKELSLSADQQQQLANILDQTAAGYRAIRERVRPEYDNVRQEGRTKIRAILTEEQRARFEELVRRSDEKRRQRREKEKSNGGHRSAPKGDGR